MSEIPTQVQLPFTESNIIFNPHVTDDENKNNIRDVDEETIATGQRPLQDFSVLGQHRMGIQQLHVSAAGELFGLSYYIEAGTNKWIINDVKNYRTYLDPTQIGMAFNHAELADFAESILAQFETSMESSGDSEFDEAMARLHYDYLFASASLLVGDDDLAARIAASLDQYKPWYQGEELIAIEPEAADVLELPPQEIPPPKPIEEEVVVEAERLIVLPEPTVTIEVEHEPEPEPVVQQLPQPESAVPVVIPPALPKLETPLSKTTARMREALLDFDGLTVQELEVIQQAVRGAKKQQFLADLATRLEDDFLSDDDRAYFEEKYSGILRADDGLRWLLDSQFQYAWTNWVMATFSDPARRLELTPEQHEYLLEKFLITVHPPVAQLEKWVFVFLSEAVLSENSAHREAAYQLLISFGESAKPLAADVVLAHVLYSSDSDPQKVLDAMGINDEEYVELLVQIVEFEPFRNYEQKTLRDLLEENDRAFVVRAAINFLAEMGPSARQAAEALIRAKFSADLETNKIIDAALAKIGIDPSIQAQLLAGYLENEDDDTRKMAARFLGQLRAGAKSQISALVARRKKEEPKSAVERTIDFALYRIDPESFPVPKAEKSHSDEEKSTDESIVANSGVLGSINSDQELDNQLGNSELDPEVQKAVGSLIGTGGTQISSGGGLGERGHGLGGGGTAEGLGGLGTKGRGSGSSGYVSTDTTGLPKASPGDAHSFADPGMPTIDGSLSSSDINRVIGPEPQFRKILGCYKVSLSEVGNQTMYVTVTIDFVIDANGRVTDVRANFSRTDLGKISVATENFSRVFRSFAFPKPPDGTKVTVSYPFIFSFAENEIQ